MGPMNALLRGTGIGAPYVWFQTSLLQQSPPSAIGVGQNVNTLQAIATCVPSSLLLIVAGQRSSVTFPCQLRL